MKERSKVKKAGNFIHTTLIVDRECYKRLKAYAAINGIYISDALKEAIEEFLKNKEKEGKF